MSRPTILFAGGGTGGHLYPSLAIVEQLHAIAGDAAPAVHFACSSRSVDARVLTAAGVPFTPLAIEGLAANPLTWPRWVGQLLRTRRHSRELLRAHEGRLVIATGGFVSVPVVLAARSLGVPTMLINLDAIAGKANRLLARWVDQRYSVFADAKLPGGAEMIGFPLRRAALAARSAGAARASFGLAGDRPTLLVAGGSLGAAAVNRTLGELARRGLLADHAAWQVLHLSGAGHDRAVRQGYESAGVDAVVEAFTDRMGDAWAAADLAISRAGAGSAAEAWANAVPTVFMPYPHHRDQHQRHNAAPLVSAGGAIIVDDHAEPAANADRLAPVLSGLLGDKPRRQAMAAALRQTARPHAADHLARKALEVVRW